MAQPKLDPFVKNFAYQAKLGGFEVRGAEDRPITLAMQRLWLTGQILPVGARLLVQHTFRNDEELPIEVLYAFMLPRDAALRRFEIRGEGFEAHSELRRVEDAVRDYEAGIDAGSLSTLARSYRDGIVNLSLGNLKRGDEVAVTLEILAGVELRDDGLRLRFPFTLAPGYHVQARMIDNEGLGEIELPQADFGDVILPRYRRAADGLHEVGFDLALRIPGHIAEIGSPSHAIRVRDEHGARRVTLAPAADVPNRDLVVDVRVTDPDTIVLGDKHFAIAIPSSKFGQVSTGARKVAMVIDRSGSMGGEPISQARRAIEACMGALSQDDEFALIAFDNQVDCFRDTLTKATASDRAAASAFLQTVNARGGTNLALGFAAGARLVSGGGDVLVITDGQVMGTEDILAQARALSVRIHCLGIGSASQDRFLAQLAAETGGVSRFVTPQERVDVAAVDLFASIGRPVATNVSATGATFAIEPSHSVFGGTPWVAFGETSERSVRIAWHEGAFEIPTPNPSLKGRENTPLPQPLSPQGKGEPVGDIADTIRLLSGARQISYLESRMTPELQTEFESRLAALSAAFGLASRAMALVAVVKRVADQAGAPPVTQVVPVGMPQGTQYDAYFAKPVMLAAMSLPAATPAGPARPGGFLRRLIPFAAGSAGSTGRDGAGVTVGRARAKDLRTAPPMQSEVRESSPLYSVPADPADRLLGIASTLAPDGGLPGGDADDRALKTVAAVVLCLSEGHTPVAGAFRAHVERMVRFLETVTGISAEHRAIIDNVTAFARAQKRPKQTEIGTWNDVEGVIG
jgi:Ca-activated chloride channel family protein